MSPRRRSGSVTAISNRLPVTKTPSGWRMSAGGLVTALRPVMRTGHGEWVGWDGGAEDLPDTVEDFDVALRPVSLTRAEVQNYYHGFSNRTIWPLFHDLVQTPVFDRSWWSAYKRVNERFAETIVARDQAESDGPLLWVHDYHLMLLPHLLRARLPRRRIGFFLHIPWPPPELFARLPWRRQIVEGLLGADVVSFHTDRYRKNFVRTCGRIMPEVEIDPGAGTLVLPSGRRVQTQENPISIDVDEFATQAASQQTKEELKRLQKQFSGQRILVGVDRLDYTKGILEKLHAFEILLEKRKDLQQKVALVQIAVPSRTAVTEYRQLRAEMEQTIGHINGRFTEPGAEVPVYYLHRGVSRPRLLAYYGIADVFLVTALKDGMNLVSKEFVVTQAATEGSGALVLSEFTGAALEFPQAVICNPFDIEGVAAAMERALEMDEDQRRHRLRAMAARVRERDIHAWAEREIGSLRGAPTRSR